MTPAVPADAQRILLRLDDVLDEERDALRLLDSRAVERIAQEKMDLDSALEQATREGNASVDPELVESVRSKVQDNQILLIHARNCVRATLEAVTGRQEESFESNRPPPRASVRVDMKG